MSKSSPLFFSWIQSNRAFVPSSPWKQLFSLMTSMLLIKFSAHIPTLFLLEPSSTFSGYIFFLWFPVQHHLLNVLLSFWLILLSHLCWCLITCHWQVGLPCGSTLRLLFHIYTPYADVLSGLWLPNTVDHFRLIPLPWNTPLNSRYLYLDA